MPSIEVYYLNLLEPYLRFSSVNSSSSSKLPSVQLLLEVHVSVVEHCPSSHSSS